MTSNIASTPAEDVWVFAEHKGGKLEDITYKLIGEGRDLAYKLGRELAIVLIGANGRELSRSPDIKGGDKAFIVECGGLERYGAEAYLKILEQLCQQHMPSVFLFGATPLGNDIAPRVAARLRASFIARYTVFSVEEGKLVARRMIHAGKAQSEVTPLRSPVVATIDPQILGGEKPREAEKTRIFEVEIEVNPDNLRLSTIDYLKADPRTVSLSEADIVIGVGKGLSKAENLRAFEEMADVLGASIGGSRRAVDEGWLPSERQIGLTGKIIKPSLYLACGISGTRYHTLGVSESKLVVAVNTDRSAPICQTAKLAVIGDMHQIIPALTEQLRETIEDVV